MRGEKYEKKMKPELHILHGPNLNVLGQRLPMYGGKDFADFFRSLEEEWREKVRLEHYQSNHAGDLIDRIHWLAKRKEVMGLIINAGGLSHTSVSLGDAIEVLRIPVVEVHLTNIYAREPYRHHSYVSAKAAVVIAGAGPEGYRWAVAWLYAQTQSR